ncbi:unnamed protein product [Sphagnum troendelagicum]|uniref:Uncharacterized protein n=1 Tax=Sphagnum troendelagicum TaxID=128251 RepID=A0ABP0U023_9BRYO
MYTHLPAIMYTRAAIMYTFPPVMYTLLEVDGVRNARLLRFCAGVVGRRDGVSVGPDRSQALARRICDLPPESPPPPSSSSTARHSHQG